MENLHFEFEILVNAVKNKTGWRDISQLAKELYTSANMYMMEHRFGGKIKGNLNSISTHAQRVWSISIRMGTSTLTIEHEKAYEEIYQRLREIQKEFKAIAEELKIALKEILI